MREAVPRARSLYNSFAFMQIVAKLWGREWSLYHEAGPDILHNLRLVCTIASWDLRHIVSRNQRKITKNGVDIPTSSGT